MSNNPFIEQTPAHARYPDISSGSPLSVTPQSGLLPQQTGFGLQPSPYNGQGYQQQQQQQYQPFLQPQYTGSPYGGGAGYQMPMMTGAARGGFQPTSSFGQQLSAQVNSGYGYNQQPQQQAYGGYGQQPPQQQSAQPPNWNAIAQFDPYAQLGNAFDSAPGSGAGLFGGNVPTSPTGAHQRGSSFSTPVTGQAPHAGQMHPRELVRAHKVELEAWDPYAWKQLMNSFDALRAAWETRKRDVQNRMMALGQAVNYDYGAAQEYRRLQGVLKDADNNHDTVAASAFQVLEVQGSYRQSSDMASKRRVRESLNSSLNALPDWPSQQW